MCRYSYINSRCGLKKVGIYGSVGSNTRMFNEIWCEWCEVSTKALQNFKHKLNNKVFLFKNTFRINVGFFNDEILNQLNFLTDIQSYTIYIHTI